MKIKRKIYISFIVVLIVFLNLQLLFAANGRISGKVADKQTGDAIPGTVLVIKNTNLNYEPRDRRLDFAAKQDLPWTGLSIYANINNITDAYNVVLAPGNGFPVSEQTYGMTANAGLRWNLIQ